VPIQKRGTRYLVGIDNGSQSTKVCIFDAQGSIVSAGTCPLRPNDTPRPGVVEHPDDDLWSSIGTASRSAMDSFDGDPAAIAGVGLCTIRFCRALLRSDGSLAHPVMSWMDERVSRPYEDDDPAVRWVTTSSGYITQRLTGRFVDTAANYAGIWPVDIDTWDWKAPGDGLEDFGVPREKLFGLVKPGEFLGAVTPQAARHTGLPAGVPVFATANDKAVEALGCGLRNKDDVLVSLGTYIAAMATGSRAALAADSFWTNYGCEPGAYLYESNGIRRGMWTVSWVLDLLSSWSHLAESRASLQGRMNEAAARVPAGSDGLMVLLDWLAPVEMPFRKGAVLGFDGRQGGAHLYRAVLEAIAMTMLARTREMSDDLGADFKRVILSGGGSNADVMMQVFADVWGIPAARMRMNNAAALGAAICAGVGSGVYPGFGDAVGRLVVEERTCVPDPGNPGVYERLLPVVGELHSHLDPVFAATSDIFG